MNIWEKFDKEFVMESDNQLASGVPLLFRVWDGDECVPDETRSLATKENVVSFFKDEFDRVTAELGHALASEKQLNGFLKDQTMRANKLEAENILLRKSAALLAEQEQRRLLAGESEESAKERE